MTQVKLNKLFSKRKAVTAILTALMGAMGASVSIQDETGKSLLDFRSSRDSSNGFSRSGVSKESKTTKAVTTSEREAIIYEGKTVGWVVGEQGKVLAPLLAHLVQKEAEKKTLAIEVLDRYRELNLLYNLSEKLSTSLALQAVAQTAMDEAHRLIQATGGALLMLNKERNRLEALVSFGSHAPTRLLLGEGIVGHVAHRGKAEIVNDSRADYRSTWREKRVYSLLAVPLKAKNSVIGVMVLHHTDKITYTAGHLKLFNTLASQVAPAIENALLYEKTVQEAQEREARLQRQIKALRIELDEAQQEKQVAEITESNYFQSLRSQAVNLRQIMAGIG